MSLQGFKAGSLSRSPDTLRQLRYQLTLDSKFKTHQMSLINRKRQSQALCLCHRWACGCCSLSCWSFPKHKICLVSGSSKALRWSELGLLQSDPPVVSARVCIFVLQLCVAERASGVCYCAQWRSRVGLVLIRGFSVHIYAKWLVCFALDVQVEDVYRLRLACSGLRRALFLHGFMR